MKLRTKIFYFFCLIGCIIMMILTLEGIKQKYLINNFGVTTSGILLEKKSSRSTHQILEFDIRVKFYTLDKHLIISDWYSIKRDFWEQVSKGDNVELKYYPRNPDLVRIINNYNPKYYPEVLLSILFIVFFFIILALIKAEYKINRMLTKSNR